MLNPRKILFAAVLMAVILSAGSCGSRPHDPRLELIATQVVDSPQVALSRLDSLDPSLMAEHDLQFYNLLSTKARDKAYIDHTTDSVILRVVDYYSSHRGSGLYPEALYYAGRVSSDLGDYPTALRYFQDALAELPDDSEYLQLRGYIVSNAACLLNGLRLYAEAVPYVKESIRIDSLTTDTFGLAYDYGLLGAIHMHKRQLDSAEVYFKKAYEVSAHLQEEDHEAPKIYLAANQYYRNNTDSALMLIRGVPSKVHRLDRGSALVYAARIYHQAGILDTAYMYARELASIDCGNQKTGYQLLLSPELSARVPLDTVRAFVVGYRAAMEEYLNKNEATQAMIQNSYYNYSTHVREKEKVQASRNRLLFLLILAILIVVILCSMVLYLKYWNSLQALHLRDALSILYAMTYQLPAHLRPTAQLPPHALPGSGPVLLLPVEEEDKREQVQNLLATIDQIDPKDLIPEYILSSSLRQTLLALVNKGRGLASTDPLWLELEQFIVDHSPEFVTNLRKSLKSKITERNRQIVILVRFGISPTDMTILLNITANAVASRRSYLGKKIFGMNVPTKTVDAFILTL